MKDSCDIHPPFLENSFMKAFYRQESGPVCKQLVSACAITCLK